MYIQYMYSSCFSNQGVDDLHVMAVGLMIPVLHLPEVCQAVVGEMGRTAEVGVLEA